MTTETIMSIEQKAKAYDEALERAKKQLEEAKVFDYEEGQIAYDIRTTTYAIFPELEESDDERIRKKIVSAMSYYRNDGCISEYEFSVCRNWLEKQKINTEGDFGRGYDCGYKACLNSHGAEFFEKQKEQKPAEYKTFKEWVEDYWSHNKVNNPYSYNKGDEIQFDHKGFVSFCEAYCCPQNLVLHDTFGYEEGRQTGQNEGVKLVLNNPEAYGLQKEQKLAEYLSKEKVFAIMNKLTSLSFCVPLGSDEEKKIHEITCDVSSLLDYPIEQKPAEWSEEDKFKLEDAITGIDVGIGFYETEGKHPNLLKAIIEAKEWLKSLRPQPKPEWSEEDEEMFDEALAGVLLARNRMNDTGCIGLAERFEKAYKWLESFRPRPHWKPSEEQMKALSETIAFAPDTFKPKCTLVTLLNDLKKL